MIFDFSKLLTNDNCIGNEHVKGMEEELPPVFIGLPNYQVVLQHLVQWIMTLPTQSAFPWTITLIEVKILFPACMHLQMCVASWKSVVWLYTQNHVWFLYTWVRSSSLPFPEKTLKAWQQESSRQIFVLKVLIKLLIVT